ncbi:hypothetical protein FKB34_16740, partial [Glycocaulis profundi]
RKWGLPSTNSSVWFQTYNQFGEFDYAIDADQLAFLKVFSSRATQTRKWGLPSTNSSVWFQTYNQFGEFDYAIDADQLAFLKVFSSRATQTLQLSCQGFSESRIMPELLADDDTVLTMMHPKRRFELKENLCGQISEGSTVVQIQGKPSRLPLRDIKFTPSVSAFGVQVGEVCFS